MRCRKWLQSMGIDERKGRFPGIHTICSRHFTEDCYRHKESKSLNSTAIPTLFPGPKEEKRSDVCESNRIGDENDQITFPIKEVFIKNDVEGNEVAFLERSTNEIEENHNTKNSQNIRKNNKCLCIICLNATSAKIDLSDPSSNMKSSIVRNMLEFVLPEIDVESSVGTKICKICTSQLLEAYSLKRTWLENAKLLQKERFNKDKNTDEATKEEESGIFKAELYNRRNVNIVLLAANDHDYCKETADFIYKVKYEYDVLKKTYPTTYSKQHLILTKEDLKQRREKRAMMKRLKRAITRPERGKPPFLCEMCGQIFNYRAALTRHKCYKNLHHKKTKPKLYKCQKCKKRFVRQRSLQLHLNLGHQKYVQCHICGEKRAPLSLRNHLKRHENSKKYCYVCNKMISNVEFNKHLKLHSGQGFECHICSKILQTKARLRNHIVACHEKGGSYLCRHCNRRFLAECRLRRHFMQMHPDEPYEMTKLTEK